MRWKNVAALDEGKLREFWGKLGHRNSLWGKIEGTSFESFRKYLADSAMILEYPFGYIRVEYAKNTGKVWIHGAFWSRDVFRGIPDLREAAKHITETMGVGELCIAIPATGRGLPHLVEQVGFKWKGTIPEFYTVGGACTDAFLYAMIVE